MSEYVLRTLAAAGARFFAFCRKVELLRKIWHALAISGVAYLSTILEGYWLRAGIVWLCFVLSFGMEWLRSHGWLPFFRYIEREGETKGDRTTAVDFVAGLAICILFAPPEVLTAALLITAWCDPAAAFVGQALGKTASRWPGSKKSVEGSIICALSAFTIALACFPRYPLAGLALVGIASSAAELCAKQHHIREGRLAGHLTPADNFFIMVTATAALHVLHLVAAA